MKKVIKIFKYLLLLFIPITVISYVNIANYPRIVRTAYFMNPISAIKATYCEYIFPKKFTKKDALNRVNNLGLVTIEKPKFLYLSHKPNRRREDTPVIERYFSIISKESPNTSETLFWEIHVSTGLAIVEATTGNVIFYEEISHDYSDFKYYKN